LSGGKDYFFRVGRKFIVGDAKRRRARGDLFLVFSVGGIGRPQRTIFLSQIITADKGNPGPVGRERDPALRLADDLLRNSAKDRSPINIGLILGVFRNAREVKRVVIGRNGKP